MKEGGFRPEGSAVGPEDEKAVAKIPQKRELLGPEMKERRADPDYREKIGSAEDVLNGYSEFVRQVKGALEYIKFLSAADPDWQNQLENLEQVGMGWKESLTEVLKDLKTKEPLPFRAEYLSHKINSCLIELDNLKVAELYGKKKGKEEVMSALENFINNSVPIFRNLGGADKLAA